MPNLILKRDSVYVIGETRVLQEPQIEWNRLSWVFRQHIYHIFVEEQRNRGAVGFIQHDVVVIYAILFPEKGRGDFRRVVIECFYVQNVLEDDGVNHFRFGIIEAL
jgi:hypothetical protein